MIRHTILFKVKSNVSTQMVENALTDMEALKHTLPGILTIITGKCRYHDDLHDQKSTNFFVDSVSHAISIDFADQDALNQFFKDPITHPAKEGIVNIAEGGYEGLVGFDLED
jgi:hypothetical protein